MVRSIAVGMLVALASAGLGLLSAPARAADPAEQPAKPGKRAEGQLWWNDPAVVERIGLSDDQRAEMDRLFETYRSAQKSAVKRGAGRSAFHEALKQGDTERARKELASWVESEGALIRSLGELKIGVLSQLSGEQRKTLASTYPGLIRRVWVPLRSWELPPQPKRPAGGKRPSQPAN